MTNLNSPGEFPSTVCCPQQILTSLWWPGWPERPSKTCSISSSPTRAGYWEKRLPSSKVKVVVSMHQERDNSGACVEPEVNDNLGKQPPTERWGLVIWLNYHVTKTFLCKKHCAPKHFQMGFKSEFSVKANFLWTMKTLLESAVYAPWWQPLPLSGKKLEHASVPDPGCAA